MASGPRLGLLYCWITDKARHHFTGFSCQESVYFLVHWGTLKIIDSYCELFSAQSVSWIRRSSSDNNALITWWLSLGSPQTATINTTLLELQPETSTSMRNAPVRILVQDAELCNQSPLVGVFGSIEVQRCAMVIFGCIAQSPRTFVFFARSFQRVS